MEAEAIKTLLDIGASHALLDIESAVAVPKDWQIVSTEKYQQHPTRLRRKFSTARLPDFITYCESRCDEDASILFINPDVSAVTAIINHGTATDPEWGDDTATLQLTHTPGFAVFYDLTRRDQSQLAFINFLEDVNDGKTIFLLDQDGAPLDISAGVAALRKVTVTSKSAATNEVQTMRSARSSMEEIEASASDPLPALVRFSGEVFTGTQERTITARMSVLTGQEKPVFSFRIIGWELVLKSLADEIEAALKSKIKAQVYVGSSAFAA